jgi:hypothetical protein
MRSRRTARLFLLPTLLVSALFLVTTETRSQQSSKLRFEVSFPATSSHDPLDGRVLLLVSSNQ